MTPISTNCNFSRIHDISLHIVYRVFFFVLANLQLIVIYRMFRDTRLFFNTVAVLTHHQNSLNLISIHLNIYLSIN